VISAAHRYKQAGKLILESVSVKNYLYTVEKAPKLGREEFRTYVLILEGLYKIFTYETISNRGKYCSLAHLAAKRYFRMHNL